MYFCNMEDFNSDISFIEQGKAEFASLRYNEIKPMHTSASGAFRLFRANHFGKWVVLKALKEEYRNDPFYETILQKEFSIGSPLKHNGVISTIDFVNLPQIGNVIVLEYVNGVTLRQYLEERSPLSRKESLRLINELGEAIAYLHSNKVIHRDLKPENIMIDSNTKTVKIIDMGCADASDYNVIKGPAGTRHYAAPEQLVANGNIDVRTDIYAFGKIISDIVTATGSKWKRATRVADKCCATAPDNRYQSVVDLLAQINKHGKSTKAALLIVALLLLVALAVTIVVTYNSNVSTELTSTTDTIYVAPARTNTEIADSIFASKAAMIAQQTDSLLHIAYVEMEQADSIEVMTSYSMDSLDKLYPNLESNTRNELAQYVSNELVDIYIQNLYQLLFTKFYSYQKLNFFTHFKRICDRLGETSSFEIMQKYSVNDQGYSPARIE